MMQQTVMIIDDDTNLRKSFEKLLKDEGYKVMNAASGEEGLQKISELLPDTILLDMQMPGMNGLETFSRIHAIEPRLPVIIMTAFGTTDSAIEATRMGAFDYILKPFDIPAFLEVIRKALEAGRFMRSPVRLDIPDGISDDSEKKDGDPIIGKSQAIQQVYKAIGRVASSDATVLIRGESGTGKELVSRAVYQYSKRSGKPFVVINCVAIPETLLESELFGYEKGAFTGANHRKSGKIEQANGGTVFLDEIGDMPLGIQAKFLRLLQEKSIERIGGRETIPVNVRIIAATNRNLEEAIRQGTFRQDIYYRLKVVTINLPPLRDRQGDLPLLTDFFLAKHAAENNMPNPGITKAGRNVLEQYPWPGNVRELSNIIQKMLIFNRGIPIDVEEINKTIKPVNSTDTPNADNADQVITQWIRHQLLDNTSESLFEDCLDEFASRLIAEALRMTGGNRTNASKLLGVSRPTLHARIAKYHIEIQTSVKSNEEATRRFNSHVQD